MSAKFKRAVLIYLVVNLLYVLAVLFVVQDNGLAMLDISHIGDVANFEKQMFNLKINLI